MMDGSGIQTEQDLAGYASLAEEADYKEATQLIRFTVFEAWPKTCRPQGANLVDGCWQAETIR